MQNILIQSISKEEIADMIEVAIERALQKHVASILPPVSDQKDNQLLSKIDAAAYLQISTVTLSKYLRSGHVKAHTVAGTRLKFKRSDLDKAIRVLRSPVPTTAGNNL